MKTEKIIWGLILVFIGGVLLLQNFGVIDFQWLVIWRFWPLVLILIGANMLFSRENSRTGAAVSVVLTIAALGFIAWQGTGAHYQGQSGWSFRYDDEEPSDIKVKNHNFNEPFTPGLKNAVLNISGGATTYKLRDTTAQLFAAQVGTSFGNYSLRKTLKDSTAILDFNMSGKKSWNMNGRGRNEAVVALNLNPVWTVNVETGAGNTNLDLSAFKVRDLHFEGGASSLDLKLGQPLEVTDVKIETGVSHVHISIPANAACKISTDSGLSSTNFQGFEKQGDDSYITPNFNSAPRKIIINLEGGLSSFEVDRY